ncbi:hypothetical protein GMRT_12820 [Giardia muris]|uniref:Uncharacterized protein n=1 Tax=Giardia muris TaxID=5742 RepID=A0A4Z1SNB1_GIAMU|nr:hypothetical protein GMRT_12820 [Giardia muris]|eukprot:TNJ27100.1 hypothetical protein GMRT_12820 [Giardia muris]
MSSRQVRTAADVATFLRENIEAIIAQYILLVREATGQVGWQVHPRAAGAALTLQHMTSTFIGTIASSVAENNAVARELEAVLGNILPRLKEHHAEILKALEPHMSTLAIDYATSIILPASLQLPLSLTLIESNEYDLIDPLSLRPGSLVCLLQGPSPSWMLQRFCVEPPKAATEITITSESSLRCIPCVVTKRWFDAPVYLEDMLQTLSVVTQPRTTNPYLVDGWENKKLTEHDLELFSSAGVQAIDGLETGGAAFALQRAPTDLEKYISNHSSSTNAARGDRFQRAGLDKAYAKVALQARFILRELQVEESVTGGQHKSQINGKHGINPPYGFPADDLACTLPWLRMPLRFGEERLIDAKAYHLCDMIPLVDPFYDQFAFCPTAGQFCFAFHKPSFEFKLALIHEAPSRANRFHARISWMTRSAASQRKKGAADDLLTASFAYAELDSTTPTDLHAWLRANTMADCPRCKLEGRPSMRRHEQSHPLPSIFCRFLLPLPVGNRLYEAAVEDIMPTTKQSRRNKRVYYGNVMCSCIRFCE